MPNALSVDFSDTQPDHTMDLHVGPLPHPLVMPHFAPPPFHRGTGRRRMINNGRLVGYSEAPPQKWTPSGKYTAGADERGV